MGEMVCYLGFALKYYSKKKNKSVEYGEKKSQTNDTCLSLLINVLGFLLPFFLLLFKNAHSPIKKKKTKLLRQVPYFLMNWIQKKTIFKSYACHNIHLLFSLSHWKRIDELAQSINKRRLKIGCLPIIWQLSFTLFDTIACMNWSMRAGTQYRRVPAHWESQMNSPFLLLLLPGWIDCEMHRLYIRPSRKEADTPWLKKTPFKRRSFFYY